MNERWLLLTYLIITAVLAVYCRLEIRIITPSLLAASLFLACPLGMMCKGEDKAGSSIMYAKITTSIFLVSVCVLLVQHFSEMTRDGYMLLFWIVFIVPAHFMGSFLAFYFGAAFMRPK